MVLLVPEHSFVTSVSEIGINMFFYVWKGCGENFNQSPGKDLGECRSLSLCKCGLVGCVQGRELGLRMALGGLWGWGGAWGALVGCVQGRELGVRAAPSVVYPAGKLQWHFTCGFDFGHCLWLPFVTAFAVLKGLNYYNLFVIFFFFFILETLKNV